jgi:hypothetical protein
MIPRRRHQHGIPGPDYSYGVNPAAASKPGHTSAARTQRGSLHPAMPALPRRDPSSTVMATRIPRRHPSHTLSLSHVGFEGLQMARWSWDLGLYTPPKEGARFVKGVRDPRRKRRSPWFSCDSSARWVPNPTNGSHLQATEADAGVPVKLTALGPRHRDACAHSVRGGGDGANQDGPHASECARK